MRVASFNSLTHFNFLRTRVTTKTPCAGAIISKQQNLINYFAQNRLSRFSLGFSFIIILHI